MNIFRNGRNGEVVKTIAMIYTTYIYEGNINLEQILDKFLTSKISCKQKRNPFYTTSKKKETSIFLTAQADPVLILWRDDCNSSQFKAKIKLNFFTTRDE